MSDQDTPKELFDMLALFPMLIEGATKNAEMAAHSSRVFADELLRFRAWETVLYLFFARYYVGKEDAIMSALADRDLLANMCRQHGGGEEVAQQIEAIYKSIAALVETGLRHKAESRPDDGASPSEHIN
jgi:hypothetical protein